MALQPSILECLACNSSSFANTEQTLVCQSCGAEYPLIDGIPVLVRDWSAHRATIDEARTVNPCWYQTEQPAEQASPWRHHLRKRRLYVTGVIERHLKSMGVARVSRLLDLGCGDGGHLGWLSDFAEEVHGSDYSLVRLTRAKHRSANANLFLADILDYPCADGTFDIVYFNHVIEHIPDDVAALRTVHRILRPGGIAIVGTPNEGAWWWQLAYRRAPETRATTDHVHFYTDNLISSRMTQAGLAVSEIKHIGWGPPDWQLDGRIRKHKWVDDAFELFGRAFIPRQASSLYVIAGKS